MDFTELAKIERELAEKNLAKHGEFYSRPYGDLSKNGTAVFGLGHYFIANGVNLWEDQIFGRILLDQAGLDSWQQFIRMNSDSSKEFNIRLCYLVVPEKQIVLPRFRWTDADGRVLDNRPINQIRSLVPDKSEFPLVYPSDAFKGMRAECELYFRGNSHWCATGCWITGLELIRFFFSDRFLRNNFSSLDIVTEPSKVQQDLVVHFYEKAPFEEIISIRYPGKKVEEHYTYAETRHYTGSYLFLLNEEALIRDRLAVIGDSYSTFLAPVLSYYFKEVHFIWTKQIPWQRLSDLKFRYVIWQSAERFLIVPPLSRILEAL
jgi:hypothetical protein